jgi:hypothetical protein
MLLRVFLESEGWPVDADPERHRRPAHVAANRPKE